MMIPTKLKLKGQLDKVVDCNQKGVSKIWAMEMKYCHRCYQLTRIDKVKNV